MKLHTSLLSMGSEALFFITCSLNDLVKVIINFGDQINNDNLLTVDLQIQPLTVIYFSPLFSYQKLYMFRCHPSSFVNQLPKFFPSSISHSSTGKMPRLHGWIFWLQIINLLCCIVDFHMFSFQFQFNLLIIFCSLLLRRECCTFSNGEYMKSGLAELEKWIANAKEMVN